MQNVMYVDDSQSIDFHTFLLRLVVVFIGIVVNAPISWLAWRGRPNVGRPGLGGLCEAKFGRPHIWWYL